MDTLTVVAICLAVIFLSMATLTGLVFYLLRHIAKLETHIEKNSPPF